ncbi:MAG: SagB/ThcOx family dehydrogenase [Gammaproteobacteria bacterium]
MQAAETIQLPAPGLSGQQSLEALLQRRHSVREYSDQALTLAQLGQLLWAAQGITHGSGYRTAPSAGALYPLELYAVVSHVTGLSKGIYHYQPGGHALVKTEDGDIRNDLAEAALSQASVAQAPVVIVFTAVLARTEKKYGPRAQRYVDIEVGHAAENLFLQAGALGLGTVDVGAFDDEGVARVLQLPPDRNPLLLMPVGRQ